MGLMMEKLLKRYNVVVAIVIFAALPILIWALGGSSQRGVLKETISVVTIVSFSMMLMQFYLARTNKNMLKIHKMSKVLNIHKIIGYVFVPILLVHPFLIVVPRYFEAGIDPSDAFLTLITSFNNTGVVLGMIAWVLMFIIGLTSVFRNSLPMTYSSWRVLHGVLSILFVVLAAWHVIELGRHSSDWMTAFIVIIATGGILLLAKTYFSKPNKGGQSNV